MRRAGRWLLWILAALAGLPALGLAVLLAFANSQAGRDWIARTAAEATAGEVKLAGLAGRFPDNLRLARLELRDKDGPWLAIDHLDLDWSPSGLLGGEVAVNRLEAGRIALDRLPPSPASAEPSGEFSLPLAVRLDSLRVARLDLAEAVVGRAVSLAIEGRARLASLKRGEAGLDIKRLDGEGSYVLQGTLDAAKIDARLSLQEPAQGLFASLAGIEELDALALEATVEGPLSALQTRLAMDFGPLHAGAQGRLDLEHEAIAALTVRASAPAMRPRADVSWQAVALDAQVHGSFTRPVAQGKLRIDGLSAAGAAVRSIALDLRGDAGRAELRGELAGLRLPGPQPDLLASAPLTVQADVQLDAAQRPVAFTLKHPLLVAEGKAVTAGEATLDMALSLPDLRPYAALGGLDILGKTALNLRLAQQADATRLEVDGSLGITGGAAPLPALLGDAARLGVSVALRGADVDISRLKLDGKALAVSAEGRLAANVAKFDWKLALHDWAAVFAGGSGKLLAQGRIDGPLDKFAVTAEVDGELATQALRRGPFNAKLKLDGLPRAPAGELTARGLLGGSPLELALAAQAPADGSLRLDIARADWKSAQAKGSLSLPKGGELPAGRIDLRMARLEDLRPLLGQPLAGSVAATLETAVGNGRPSARLKLDAQQAGLAGTATVGQASLDLAVGDPVRKPVFDGRLKLEGISAGTLADSAGLDLAGPLEALKLRLSARLPDLAGAEMRLDSAASLDANARQLALAEWQAVWKGETLRLLAPARIAFKDGVAVERLRLGLRQAVLEVSGKVGQKLDLDARLNDVDAGLAALFAPDFAADGVLNAEAKLAGPPARPTGTVAVKMQALRLRAGPARSLPPLNLVASAHLAGPSAQVEGWLDAGRDFNLNISGEAPLAASGSLALRAAGSADLKLLDPLLAAGGRRVRGQLALDAALAGDWSAPQVTGSLRLAGGELADYASGAHLSDIAALLEAEGGKIRIGRLEGRAGPGTVAVGGEVDLLGEGMPVNLTVAARNARPLAGDRLSVDLNADVAVRGQLKGALAAAGAIHIKRAEIRIPEKLPASVAVLKVRRPGAAPPPPAPEREGDISLNLVLDAPGQIFVRGRGLDAELGGKVQVRGTAAKPQPDGGFELRRGDFSLAGQRLVFSKGEVGFDGGSLADPSLDFVAKTTAANVTAFLNVGGTASKPKITLSSIPDLPQDEVLAHLLFGRAASSLSPLEMVQIASAVAALTGATAGVGDPLERVRKTLGLDRLSVGTALEAGRYVAPGVYVGAKQGISGTSTQATVQIDIAKGLKLEGAAGTAPAGNTSGSAGANSVGVVYQYEY